MLKCMLVANHFLNFLLASVTFLFLLLYFLFKFISLYILQVTFYEALKDLSDFGKRNFFSHSNYNVNSSVEGLLLGGLAGGV